MGHPHVKTPNLDRIAREGVLFENACCAYPVCTASRGAIHTGRWPHVQGPHLNVGAPDSDPEKGLSPDEIIMGSIFHDLGFTTTHYGKWHLGDIRRHNCYNWKHGLNSYHPAYSQYLRDVRGDYPVNVPEGDSELSGWPIYMTDACRKALLKASSTPKKRSGQNLLKIGRWSLPLEIDKTTFVTDSLLKDLDIHGKEPFMMAWSVDPPHAEWLVQEPYYSAVDIDKVDLPENLLRPTCYERQTAAKLFDALGEDGVKEYLRCYYGLVMKVDDQIGRILDKLEEIGELDDTLIVFVSDHGDMNGAHKAVGKSLGAFYDEIVRVPLLMRWPKGIPAGRRVRTFANGVDILPTILDYSGIPVPAQSQGESLRRFIDGDEDMQRAGFCERTHPTAQAVGRMIQTHEWKFALDYENWSSADRSFKERIPAALFHIAEDPGEERNLADNPKFSEIHRQLTQRLVDWMRSTHDPWLERLPNDFRARGQKEHGTLRASLLRRNLVDLHF